MSLFTGAGGLDLGLEAGGFDHLLCVENDDDCKKTLRQNRPKWRLSDPGDIHELSPERVLKQAGVQRRNIALVAGGPPCQPFSKSAYWSNGDGKRLKDPRAKTLDAFMAVIEAALPRAVLLENVKGLAYSGKDEAVELIRREFALINKRHGTAYDPVIIHLNAADYGVPQMRERVFVIASRDGIAFRAPAPTHGTDAHLLRYATAWDAIGDLDVEDWADDLKPKGKWAGLLPSIPEGQNYLWHTSRNVQSGGTDLFGWRTRFWSFLLKLAKNQPAWTIQAQPGPATGPFHWRSRLLSIEELSRLQTFPNGYAFSGDRLSAHRQIGNAVPSAIGELLGLEIRRQLFGERVRHGLRLTPAARCDCPPPERRGRVPVAYKKLAGRHEDHPGPGLGPGALKRDQTAEP